jgi:hypothetical protein
VVAPGQGGARAEHGVAQLGGVAIPLAAVGDVGDAEAAADVDDARPQSPALALVHDPDAGLQGDGLLGEAGRVEVVGDADEFDGVPEPFDRVKEGVHLAHGRAEAAAPREHPDP